MKKLIASVLVLTFLCSPIWAAPHPDQKHIDNIKKKVADCVETPRRVSIETYDDRRLQGSISEADADTFVLTNEGRSTTLAYSDVKQIKWPSPLSRQVKVGIITTVVTGTLFGIFLLLGARS